MLWSRGAQEEARHGPFEHTVASGASPAPDRRRAVLVHLVRRLRGAIFRRSEPRPVGPYAERVFRCLAAGTGAHLAETEAGPGGGTDRVLVFDLFASCPGRRTSERQGGAHLHFRS